jgi:hypothetical protein
MSNLIDPKSERRTRDIAIWLVRLSTFVSAAAALGLTWAFSGLAQAYFSGKPPAPAPTVVPAVPVAAAPVQQPPKVEQTIVHHPSAAVGAGAPRAPGPAAPGAAAPRPPSSGPAPPPAPPPPPVCKSTPSKPC